MLIDRSVGKMVCQLRFCICAMPACDCNTASLGHHLCGRRCQNEFVVVLPLHLPATGCHLKVRCLNRRNRPTLLRTHLWHVKARWPRQRSLTYLHNHNRRKKMVMKNSPDVMEVLMKEKSALMLSCCWSMLPRCADWVSGSCFGR